MLIYIYKHSAKNDHVFEHKMHIFGIQIQSFNHIVHKNNINNNCYGYDFECFEQYIAMIFIYLSIFLHYLFDKIIAVLIIKSIQNHHIAKYCSFKNNIYMQKYSKVMQKT